MAYLLISVVCGQFKQGFNGVFTECFMRLNYGAGGDKRATCLVNNIHQIHDLRQEKVIIGSHANDQVDHGFKKGFTFC